MCGFAGFLGYGDLRPEDAQSVVIRMGDAIAHRGPDDFDVWRDDPAQVVLVHRRLSILDLSPAGHQPMLSPSERFVIALNGELYNHLELRHALPSVTWRGHSDTETMLAGIEAWGLEVTLKRSVGMFALALWDRQDRVLYLARDRMGEKPLYYGWQRGVFLFGSDLKALKVHPAFVGEIDRDAMALLLRHNYIPAPYSIYRGLRKLPPGQVLRLNASVMTPGAPAEGRGEQLGAYWSFAAMAERQRADPFAGSDTEAVTALDALLRDAVAQQMVADVPLGAFLSGGVDSSTIVALMQAQSTRPVKTFTIGFHEASHNEAEHAKAVARHLGTEHTELYVTPRQALDVIPRLPALYSEPFADSSQIPTFLVSEMTRHYVTVSLSGDAGDELFGGYGRYFKTQRWWERIQIIPQGARRLGADGIRSFLQAGWNRRRPTATGLASDKTCWLNMEDKLGKLAGILRAEDSSTFYMHFISHWPDPGSIVINGREPSTQVTRPILQLPSIVDQMMALDALSYLPDDILCKVDRAAMGVSLETRVPMLDHRVVEFAWRLPLNMKIRDGQGKWILRKVLDKYVPRDLIDRPKMGFGVPIGDWLRGPLRDWAENLLDASRLRQEGFLQPGPIRQKWIEHLSGQRNWQYHLWDVLMFQAWLEQERRS